MYILPTRLHTTISSERHPLQLATADVESIRLKDPMTRLCKVLKEALRLAQRLPLADEEEVCHLRIKRGYDNHEESANVYDSDHSNIKDYEDELKSPRF